MMGLVRQEPIDTLARLARLMVTAVFFAMLVGGFSLSRLGLPALPVSEGAIVTTMVALVFVPLWLGAPSRSAQQSQLGAALGLVLGLIAVLLFSSAWGAWGPGTGNLVFSLLLVAVQVTLGAMAISLHPRAAAQRLVWLFLGVGVAYSLLGLVALGASGRLSVLGGGPNIYGRMVGLGMVALLGALACRWVQLRAAVLLPLLAGALVLSGSRGSMAGAVAGVAVLLFLPADARRRALVAAASAVLAGLAVSVVWSGPAAMVSESFRLRVLELTIGDRYLSGRETLLPVALEIFRDHPIVGGGLGSFAAAVGEDTYPHNLVLSVVAASGLLGGAFLVLILMMVFRASIGAHRDSLRVVVLALSCTVLVSTMSSGGLFDSRYLWLIWLSAVALSMPIESPEIQGGSPLTLVRPER